MKAKEFYKIADSVKDFGEQISDGEFYHHSLGVFYYKNINEEVLVLPNGKFLKNKSFKKI